MKSLFQKLISSDFEASSKRFICIVLVVVYVVSHFLLMYLKIEIANKDLVRNSQSDIFWMILIFGGFIAAEPVLNKLKLGGPSTIISQDVKEQNVTSTEKQVSVKKGK